MEGVGGRVNEFYSLFQRISFFAPTTTTEMSQGRADLCLVHDTPRSSLFAVGHSSLCVVVPDSSGNATYVVLTALQAFTSQDGN